MLKTQKIPRQSKYLIKFLKKVLVGLNNCRCTTTTHGITIYQTSPSAYRTIVSCLKENNALFPAYQLSEKKSYRAVIRGLHHSFNEGLTRVTKGVSDELRKMGYQVQNVNRR